MKNFIIALKNDTLRHTQNACKNEPLWHFFLTLMKTFHFIKFECIIVICAFTLLFSLQNDILYCHSLYRVDTLTTSWPTLMHLENEYLNISKQN
jgi:hypothetical protein